MAWDISFTSKAAKQARQLPQRQYAILASLIIELQADGPARWDWPNYSVLADDVHHCHLSYRWVACWRANKPLQEICIYYVGSRENAPY